MSDEIKLCDCGCMYDSPECPYCNRVTDKDRIEELEAKLAKAVEAEREAIAAGIEAKIGQHVHSQSLTALALRDIADAIRARTPADALAELKGQDDAVLHGD